MQFTVDVRHTFNALKGMTWSLFASSPSQVNNKHPGLFTLGSARARYMSHLRTGLPMVRMRHLPAPPGGFAFKVLIFNWLVSPVLACTQCWGGLRQKHDFPEGKCVFGCISETNACAVCRMGMRTTSGDCKFGCLEYVPSVGWKHIITAVIVAAPIIYFSAIWLMRQPVSEDWLWCPEPSRTHRPRLGDRLRALFRRRSLSPRSRPASYSAAAIAGLGFLPRAEALARPAEPGRLCVQCRGDNSRTRAFPDNVCVLGCQTYLHTPKDSMCSRCALGMRSEFPFNSRTCVLGCADHTLGWLHCARCKASPPHKEGATVPASRCALGCEKFAPGPTQCLQCNLGPLMTKPFPAQSCVLGCARAATVGSQPFAQLVAASFSVTVGFLMLYVAYKYIRRVTVPQPQRLRPITLIDRVRSGSDSAQPTTQVPVTTSGQEVDEVSSRGRARSRSLVRDFATNIARRLSRSPPRNNLPSPQETHTYVEEGSVELKTPGSPVTPRRKTAHRAKLSMGAPEFTRWITTRTRSKVSRRASMDPFNLKRRQSLDGNTHVPEKSALEEWAAMLPVMHHRQVLGDSALPSPGNNLRGSSPTPSNREELVVSAPPSPTTLPVNWQHGDQHVVSQPDLTMVPPIPEPEVAPKPLQSATNPPPATLRSATPAPSPSRASAPGPTTSTAEVIGTDPLLAPTAQQPTVTEASALESRAPRPRSASPHIVGLPASPRPITPELHTASRLGTAEPHPLRVTKPSPPAKLTRRAVAQVPSADVEHQVAIDAGSRIQTVISRPRSSSAKSTKSQRSGGLFNWSSGGKQVRRSSSTKRKSVEQVSPRTTNEEAERPPRQNCPTCGVMGCPQHCVACGHRMPSRGDCKRCARKASRTERPHLALTKATPHNNTQTFSPEDPATQILTAMRSSMEKIAEGGYGPSAASDSSQGSDAITYSPTRASGLHPHIFPTCEARLPTLSVGGSTKHECWRDLYGILDLIKSTPQATMPVGPACSNCIKQLYKDEVNMSIPGTLGVAQHRHGQRTINVTELYHYSPVESRTCRLTMLPDNRYLGGGSTTTESVDLEYPSYTTGLSEFCTHHGRRHRPHKRCSFLDRQVTRTSLVPRLAQHVAAAHTLTPLPAQPAMVQLTPEQLANIVSQAVRSSQGGNRSPTSSPEPEFRVQPLNVPITPPASPPQPSILRSKQVIWAEPSLEEQLQQLTAEATVGHTKMNRLIPENPYRYVPSPCLYFDCEAFYPSELLESYSSAMCWTKISTLVELLDQIGAPTPRSGPLCATCLYRLLERSPGIVHARITARGTLTADDDESYQLLHIEEDRALLDLPQVRGLIGGQANSRSAAPPQRSRRRRRSDSRSRRAHDLSPHASRDTFEMYQVHIYRHCPHTFSVALLRYLEGQRCWRQLESIQMVLATRQLSADQYPGPMCLACALRAYHEAGLPFPVHNIIHTALYGSADAEPSTKVPLVHAGTGPTATLSIPTWGLIGAPVVAVSKGIAGAAQVENRDAHLYDAYKRAMLQVNLLNQFEVPPAQMKILQQYGIQPNPEPVNPHPHPGHKVLENMFLRMDAPLALNTLAEPYTALCMSKKRQMRMKEVAPLMSHSPNFQLAAKDPTRYGNTIRSNTFTSITTPVAFMHDVLHHLSPLDVITMFKRSPAMHTLLCTAIIPFEASNSMASLWPEMYVLSYPSSDASQVTYIPMGPDTTPHHGGSYTQPRHAVFWLMHHTFRALDLSLNLAVLEHRCAHVLIQITRKSVIPNTINVIPTPNMALLPDLTTPPRPWANGLVPFETYHAVLTWACTVPLNKLNTFHELRSAILAKAKQLVPPGETPAKHKLPLIAETVAHLYPYIISHNETTALSRLTQASWTTWLMRLLPTNSPLHRYLGVRTISDDSLQAQLLNPQPFVLRVRLGLYELTDLDRATTWITAGLQPARLSDLLELGEAIVLGQPEPAPVYENNPDTSEASSDEGVMGFGGTHRYAELLPSFDGVEQPMIGFTPIEQDQPDGLAYSGITGRVQIDRVELPFLTGSEIKHIAKATWKGLGILLVISGFLGALTSPEAHRNPAAFIVHWVLASLPIGPLITSLTPSYQLGGLSHSLYNAMLTDDSPSSGGWKFTLPGLISATLAVVLHPMLIVVGPMLTAITCWYTGLHTCADPLSAIVADLQAILGETSRALTFNSSYYAPSLMPLTYAGDAFVLRFLTALIAWLTAPSGPATVLLAAASFMIQILVFFAAQSIYILLHAPRILIELFDVLTMSTIGYRFMLITKPIHFILVVITPSMRLVMASTQIAMLPSLIATYTYWGFIIRRTAIRKVLRLIDRMINRVTVLIIRWLLAGGHIYYPFPAMIRAGYQGADQQFRGKYVHIEEAYLVGQGGRLIAQRVAMKMQPVLPPDAFMRRLNAKEFNELYLQSPRLTNDKWTDDRAKMITSVAEVDQLGVALSDAAQMQTIPQLWKTHVADPYVHSRLQQLLAPSWPLPALKDSALPNLPSEAHTLWALGSSKHYWRWARAVARAQMMNAPMTRNHALVVTNESPGPLAYIAAHGAPTHHLNITVGAGNTLQADNITNHVAKPDGEWPVFTTQPWGLIVVHLPKASALQRAKVLRVCLARATATTPVLVLEHGLLQPLHNVLNELDDLRFANPMLSQAGWLTTNAPNYPNRAVPPEVTFHRPHWAAPDDKWLSVEIVRHDFDPTAWTVVEPNNGPYTRRTKNIQVLEDLLFQYSRSLYQSQVTPERRAQVMNAWLTDKHAPGKHDQHATLIDLPVHGRALAGTAMTGHPILQGDWARAPLGAITWNQQTRLANPTWFQNRINPAHLGANYAPPPGVGLGPTPAAQVEPNLFLDNNLEHRGGNNRDALVHMYVWHGARPARQGVENANHGWDPVNLMRTLNVHVTDDHLRRVLFGLPAKLVATPRLISAKGVGMHHTVRNGDTRTVGTYPNWAAANTKPIGWSVLPEVHPEPPRDNTSCVLDTLHELTGTSRAQIWNKFMTLNPTRDVVQGYIRAGELIQFLEAMDWGCYLHIAEGTNWQYPHQIRPASRTQMHALLSTNSDDPRFLHMSTCKEEYATPTARDHLHECPVCIGAALEPARERPAMTTLLDFIIRPFKRDFVAANALAKELERKNIGVLGHNAFHPLRDLDPDHAKNVMKANRGTHNDRVTPTCTILGVPGSAKTQSVLEALCSNYPQPTRSSFMVVSPTRVLSDSTFKRYSDMRSLTKVEADDMKGHFLTFELALRRSSGVDTLVVDEVGLYPPGYLDLLLFMLPRAERMIITGDPTQRGYQHSPSTRGALSTNFLELPTCIARATSCATKYIGYTYRLANQSAASLGVIPKLNKLGKIMVTKRKRVNLPTLMAEKHMKQCADEQTTAGTYIVNSCQGVDIKGDYQIIVSESFKHFDAKTWFTMLSRGQANVYICVGSQPLTVGNETARHWVQRVNQASGEQDRPVDFSDLGLQLIASNVPETLRVAFGAIAVEREPTTADVMRDLTRMPRAQSAAWNDQSAYVAPQSIAQINAAHPNYPVTHDPLFQPMTLQESKEMWGLTDMPDEMLIGSTGPPNPPITGAKPGLINYFLRTAWHPKVANLPFTRTHPAYEPVAQPQHIQAEDIKATKIAELHYERIPFAAPTEFQHLMVDEQQDPQSREMWSERLWAYSQQFGAHALASEATSFAQHKPGDRVTAQATYKKRLRYSEGYTQSTATQLRAGVLLFDAFVSATEMFDVPFDPQLFEQCQAENAGTQVDKPQDVMNKREDRFDPDWDYRTFKASVKGQWKKKLGAVNAPAGPGQTIACYRGDYVLNLGAVGRYIAHQLKRKCRKEILVYTGMNQKELSNKLMETWNFNQESEEDDYTAFDQSQDAAFLEFELLLMRHLGIPDHLVQEYEQHKRCTKCQIGVRDLAILRFSGEFGTFILNCTANIAYTNLKYNIPRNAIQLYAGDDLVVNARRTQRATWPNISRYFLLKSKPVVTMDPTFCSMAVTPGGLVRNPKDLVFRALHSYRRGVLHRTGPALALDLRLILDAYSTSTTLFSDHQLAAIHVAHAIIESHARVDPLTHSMLHSTVTNGEFPTPYGAVDARYAKLINAHITTGPRSVTTATPRVEWMYRVPDLIKPGTWSGVTPNLDQRYKTQRKRGVAILDWSEVHQQEGVPTVLQNRGVAATPAGLGLLAPYQILDGLEQTPEVCYLVTPPDPSPSSTVPFTTWGHNRAIDPMGLPRVKMTWLTEPAPAGNTFFLLVQPPTLKHAGNRHLTLTG
nr:MAG: putative RNA-dependent RNA polymerase [Leptosphaerulina chartarum flexivirus 1]